MTSLEDRKGDPIKLLGSTFQAHKYMRGAWMDTGKAHTPHYYYIIVEKWTQKTQKSFIWSP